MKKYRHINKVEHNFPTYMKMSYNLRRTTFGNIAFNFIHSHNKKILRSNNQCL